MRKPQVTVVVALKDSAHRTKQFLRHSIHDEFQYLFLDGSFSDTNETLLRNVRRSNVRYLRYPADRNLADFYRKMADGTGRIDTPLSVVVDSGDYVLADGLLAAQAALQDESGLSSAGGDILAVREWGTLMSQPWPAPACHRIAQLDFVNAMGQIAQQYTYLWYAVQRTELLHRSWTTIVQADVQHPYMEYLPTVCLLAHGPYCDTGVTHLVRVAHGPLNWTKWSASDVLRTGQPEDTDLLKKFGDLCHREFGVEATIVTSAFAPNVTDIRAQFGRVNQLLEHPVTQWVSGKLPFSSEGSYSSIQAIYKTYVYWTPIPHGRTAKQMMHYRRPWVRRNRRLAEIGGR